MSDRTWSQRQPYLMSPHQASTHWSERPCWEVQGTLGQLCPLLPAEFGPCTSWDREPPAGRALVLAWLPQGEQQQLRQLTGSLSATAWTNLLCALRWREGLAGKSKDL